MKGFPPSSALTCFVVWAHDATSIYEGLAMLCVPWLGSVQPQLRHQPLELESGIFMNGYLIFC